MNHEKPNKPEATKVTAIHRFETTMARCHALVELASRGNGNEDCLRMAIVLGVSALEWYVKDRFLESLARYCRFSGGKFNKALAQRLQKAGISTDFWTQAAICGQARPLRSVRNKMARHLRSFAIQKAATIDELFACYGIPGITTHSAQSARLETVKTSIKRMIRRRHDIAHASDYLISGKLRPADLGEVELRLDRLERFVRAMEKILVSKFSPYNARRPR